MWNSNSMMSWVITTPGIDVESIQQPVAAQSAGGLGSSSPGARKPQPAEFGLGQTARTSVSQEGRAESIPAHSPCGRGHSPDGRSQPG
jgi:hypothetical protein